MPTFHSTFDVCIRGSGIVGQTLALLLAHERLRVALVDAQDAFDDDIRAYALNSASQKLLESVRCWQAESPKTQVALRHNAIKNESSKSFESFESITPILQMQIQGDQNGFVQFSAQEQNVDALTWIADVGALKNTLSNAVRYQPLIERVNQAVSAPLTIIAEGRDSQTREALGVKEQSHAYPQTAIAAHLESNIAHQQIAKQWFLNQEILALLPRGGKNGSSYALVWSVLHEHVDELLALSNEDFANKIAQITGLPENTLSVSSARLHWALRQSQAENWCGLMPHSSDEKWVLVGDAAHCVHPLAGQGLNLGLADAAALAKIVRERPYWRHFADIKLLRQFERERKASMWSIAKVCDGLQMLFDSQIPAVQWVRNLGMKGFDQSSKLKNWAGQLAMKAND